MKKRKWTHWYIKFAWKATCNLWRKLRIVAMLNWHNCFIISVLHEMECLRSTYTSYIIVALYGIKLLSGKIIIVAYEKQYNGYYQSPFNIYLFNICFVKSLNHFNIIWAVWDKYFSRHSNTINPHLAKPKPNVTQYNYHLKENSEQSDIKQYNKQKSLQYCDKGCFLYLSSNIFRFKFVIHLMMTYIRRMSLEE